MFVEQTVNGAESCCQDCIIFSQLGEHIERVHELSVIIFDTLNSCDMADRAQCRAARFADAFRDRIRHGVQLVRMFVEHEMVVPKMRAAHMPMEVLRFHIEGEDIGENRIHATRDILRRVRGEVRRGNEGRFTPSPELLLLDVVIHAHGSRLVELSRRSSTVVQSNTTMRWPMRS